MRTPPPAHLRSCLMRLTPLPAGGWSAAQTQEIVARLVKSEADKVDCAIQLYEFIGDLGVK